MTPSEVRAVCLKEMGKANDHVVLTLTKNHRPDGNRIRVADSGGPLGKVMSVVTDATDPTGKPKFKVMAAFPAQKMYDYATAVMTEMLSECVSECCDAEILVFEDHLSCSECGDRITVPGV